MRLSVVLVFAGVYYLSLSPCLSLCRPCLCPCLCVCVTVTLCLPSVYVSVCVVTCALCVVACHMSVSVFVSVSVSLSVSVSVPVCFCHDLLYLPVLVPDYSYFRILISVLLSCIVSVAFSSLSLSMVTCIQ